VDRFESLFFQLKEEMEEYAKVGVHGREFWELGQSIAKAEKAYIDFKRRTGIRGIYKGGNSNENVSKYKRS